MADHVTTKSAPSGSSMSIIPPPTSSSVPPPHQASTTTPSICQSTEPQSLSPTALRLPCSQRCSVGTRVQGLRLSLNPGGDGHQAPLLCGPVSPGSSAHRCSSDPVTETQGGKEGTRSKPELRTNFWPQCPFLVPTALGAGAEVTDLLQQSSSNRRHRNAPGPVLS